MHILRWHCDLRWFTSFIEECLKNLIFQWNRQMYILYFLFCLKKSQQCFFRMYFASFFFTNPWMTLNAFWQISFRKHSTSAMLGNPRLGQANHGEAAQQAAGLVVSAFTWKCLNQDAVSITPMSLKVCPDYSCLLFPESPHPSSSRIPQNIWQRSTSQLPAWD